MVFKEWRFLQSEPRNYSHQCTSTQLPSWRSLSVLRLFSASPRLLLPGLDTYVLPEHKHTTPFLAVSLGSTSLLSFTQAVITRLRYLRKPEHKHTTPFLAVSLSAQAHIPSWRSPSVLRLFSASPRLLLPGLDTYVSQSTSTHPFLAVSGSPSLLSFTQAVIRRYLRKPEQAHNSLPGGLSQVLRLFSASPRLLLPGLDTYVSQSTSTQLPSWRSLSGSPSLLSFTQAVITRLRYLRKPEHKHTTPFLAVLRLFSASPRLLLPGLDTYVSQSTSTQLPSWRSLSGSTSLLSFTQAVITRLRYLRKPEHKHTTPFLAVLRLFSASPRLLSGLDTYVSQSQAHNSLPGGLSQVLRLFSASQAVITRLRYLRKPEHKHTTPFWRSLSGSPSLLSFTQAVITRLRYLRKPEHKHTTPFLAVLRLFSASPRLLLPGLDTYVSQSTSTQLPSWRSLSGSPSLLSFTQAVITRLRYLRKPEHKHTTPFLAVSLGSPSLLSFTQAVITRLRYLRKPEHKHTTPFLAVLRLFSASPRLLLPGLDTYVSQSTSTQLPSWRSLSGSPSLLSFTQAVITRLRYLRARAQAHNSFLAVSRFSVSSQLHPGCYPADTYVSRHKHTTPFLAVSLGSPSLLSFTQAVITRLRYLRSPSLLSFTQAVITRLRYLRKPEHKHTTPFLAVSLGSPSLLSFTQAVITRLRYLRKPEHKHTTPFLAVSLGSPSLLSFTQAVITRLRYLRKPVHKHTTRTYRLFLASLRMNSFCWVIISNMQKHTIQKPFYHVSKTKTLLRIVECEK
ncbi:hypothetical protein J6590_029634 [Homalodisca vitripennis]|nr:hypothetical protein J6590_029634 [Homalodisca vitripennis]